MGRRGASQQSWGRAAAPLALTSLMIYRGGAGQPGVRSGQRTPQDATVKPAGDQNLSSPLQPSCLASCRLTPSGRTVLPRLKHGLREADAGILSDRRQTDHWLDGCVQQDRGACRVVAEAKWAVSTIHMDQRASSVTVLHGSLSYSLPQ
ncbi:hypothetical protein E2C01_000278 [Portunus trituberculatus]|uniref:Secreted protein n=1 Tax=Portunus trituberculatus TaxID=210409 RepID=A0A5B7CG25_PORTR|nr:hypothetical protein [Portunus trituberculatus]